MYLNKSVAVVVPCKNEGTQIASVIRRMPQLVDAILVVDDGSTDATREVVTQQQARDGRVQLIVHDACRGVGAAIASGYKAARDQGYDVTVVMAGDGQMDPDDLELVVYPVASGAADYSKGNRFKYLGGLKKIPTTRKVGNYILSVLTKVVSGYWQVSDTQTGYTAIGLAALEELDLESIYAGYGCPNDILVKLNIAEMRVAEVPVNPLYNVGERSKMKILRIVGPILWLLTRGFLARMFRKHVVRNSHPLVLAYFCASICFSVCLWATARVVLIRFFGMGYLPMASLITAGISGVMGLQFLLTSCSMDFEANRHLYVELSREKLRELAPAKAVRRRLVKLPGPSEKPVRAKQSVA